MNRHAVNRHPANRAADAVEDPAGTKEPLNVLSFKRPTARCARSDVIAILDEQGAFGTREEFGATLGKRNDIGGQVVFTTEEAKALSLQKLPDGRYPQVIIVSQINVPDPAAEYHALFGDKFSEPVSYLPAEPEERRRGVKPVMIVRLPASEEHQSRFGNVSKEDLVDGRNVMWDGLPGFARAAAGYLHEAGLVPGTVVAPFGLGAAAAPIVVESFASRGVDVSGVRVVGHVHSAGEKTGAAFISEGLGKEGAADAKYGAEALAVIDDFLDVRRRSYANRMIAQAAGGWRGAVLASADDERDSVRFGTSGFPVPYDLPGVATEGMTIVSPGVSPIFYPRYQAGQARLGEMEQLLPAAREHLARISTLFADDDKVCLVVRGRLTGDQTEDRKGFAFAASALASVPEAAATANLLLLGGEPRPDGDRSVLHDVGQFPGHTTDGRQTVAGRVREAVSSSPEAAGSIALYALTRFTDQAALLQAMGEENDRRLSAGLPPKYVSALAGPESYGLVFPEALRCGVPCFGSDRAGAALRFAGSAGTETYRDGDASDFACALLKTVSAAGERAVFDRQVAAANASEDSWEHTGRRFTEAMRSAPTVAELWKTPVEAGGFPLVNFVPTDPRSERLVGLAKAYFVEQFAERIFTPDFVRSVVPDRPYGPEAVAKAKERVLDGYGVVRLDGADPDGWLPGYVAARRPGPGESGLHCPIS